MAKTRNRRLRKKLHFGEFVEKGFEVAFSLRPEVTQMDFLVSITDVLFPNKMAFSKFKNEEKIFVSGRESSLEDKDRTLVAAWLEQQNYVTSSDVGHLVDAWHPPRSVRCGGSRRGTLELIKLNGSGSV